jgi:lipid A oxidase
VLILRLSFPLALVLCLSARSAAQWTAGGYLGAAHTQNHALVIQQPSLNTDIRFNDVAYRGESFQPPLYYGVRGGYWLHRHWGAELEFIHLKVFANADQPAVATGTLNGATINARVPINTIVQRFSISHGVNLLVANAVLHQELGRANDESRTRAHVVLRLGVGATIPHAESTIQNAPDEHYQVGSPAIQLAASVEVRTWDRLYWMGEYKFTRARERVDVNSGTATTLLESHHLVTGPVIHF